MTYGELKRKVLELMDRATVAGSDISPAYNGQSDVLRRIPGLLNDAVMRIRDRIPLEDQVLLGKTQGEAVYVWVQFGRHGRVSNAHATGNVNMDSWETAKS